MLGAALERLVVRGAQARGDCAYHIHALPLFCLPIVVLIYDSNKVQPRLKIFQV